MLAGVGTVIAVWATRGLPDSRLVNDKPGKAVTASPRS
jgi:hypothetical protein